MSVRAGLAAKARRIRGIEQRQIAAVENLAAVQVRQRHFGGRNEEQIPVAGDLEQVLLELRQLTRAFERGTVDEERRLHLAVSVLARVQIEHEVDEGPGHPGTAAAQH